MSEEVTKADRPTVFIVLAGSRIWGVFSDSHKAHLYLEEVRHRKRDVDVEVQRWIVEK